MCEVYEFPKKIELPEDEKEILNLLGEAYVLALYNSILKLAGDDPTYETLEEINLLVKHAFAAGMSRAIEKQEKGF